MCVYDPSFLRSHFKKAAFFRELFYRTTSRIFGRNAVRLSENTSRRQVPPHFFLFSQTFITLHRKTEDIFAISFRKKFEEKA